jgi:hypothetical protein
MAPIRCDTTGELPVVFTLLLTKMFKPAICPIEPFRTALGWAAVTNVEF